MYIVIDLQVTDLILCFVLTIYNTEHCVQVHLAVVSSTRPNLNGTRIKRKILRLKTISAPGNQSKCNKAIKHDPVICIYIRHLNELDISLFLVNMTATLRDIFIWIIILGIGILVVRKYGDFFRNPQISYPKLNCRVFTLNYFREIKISFWWNF